MAPLRAAATRAQRLPPAARFPNGRCDSRARSAARPARGRPPCVRRIRNCRPFERLAGPAHPDVLRQPEKIAARAAAQQLIGQRQGARGTGCLGGQLVDRVVVGEEHARTLSKGARLDEPFSKSAQLSTEPTQFHPRLKPTLAFDRRLLRQLIGIGKGQPTRRIERRTFPQRSE